ncbi:MAG: 50S ribosomal protein L21 [Planctomycetota bacterium]|nr:50S ribosomal protein L21 [Planctomycetota bacterium]
MYAVVRDRSRCLNLTAGQEAWVDLLDVEPGAEITFDEVQILKREDGSIAVGTPAVAGARVVATVIRHEKDEKIRVSFYRRRKASMKQRGHRQAYTRIRVKEILG